MNVINILWFVNVIYDGDELIQWYMMFLIVIMIWYWMIYYIFNFIVCEWIILCMFIWLMSECILSYEYCFVNVYMLIMWLWFGMLNILIYDVVLTYYEMGIMMMNDVYCSVLM